jgi:hypothetical protein
VGGVIFNSSFGTVNIDAVSAASATSGGGIFSLGTLTLI